MDDKQRSTNEVLIEVLGQMKRAKLAIPNIQPVLDTQAIFAADAKRWRKRARNLKEMEHGS